MKYLCFEVLKQWNIFRSFFTDIKPRIIWGHISMFCIWYILQVVPWLANTTSGPWNIQSSLCLSSVKEKNLSLPFCFFPTAIITHLCRQSSPPTTKTVIPGSYFTSLPCSRVVKWSRYGQWSMGKSLQRNSQENIFFLHKMNHPGEEFSSPSLPCEGVIVRQFGAAAAISRS